MVSQILWKRERMGEQRCISEKLCKVEELCDHLKDMKFEDVHKVDENSKVITFEKRLDHDSTRRFIQTFRKLVTTLVMKIYQTTMNLSITCSVLLPVMVCQSQVRVKTSGKPTHFIHFTSLQLSLKIGSLF